MWLAEWFWEMYLAVTASLGSWLWFRLVGSLVDSSFSSLLGSSLSNFLGIPHTLHTLWLSTGLLCPTHPSSQSMVAQGPTQLMLFLFYSHPPFAAIWERFWAVKLQESLKGWMWRTIILSYILTFRYLLWNLIELGHLFFTYDSLYSFFLPIFLTACL